MPAMSMAAGPARWRCGAGPRADLSDNAACFRPPRSGTFGEGDCLHLSPPAERWRSEGESAPRGRHHAAGRPAQVGRLLRGPVPSAVRRSARRSFVGTMKVPRPPPARAAGEEKGSSGDGLAPRGAGPSRRFCLDKGHGAVIIARRTGPFPEEMQAAPRDSAGSAPNYRAEGGLRARTR
jgi:hypothetical protein